MKCPECGTENAVDTDLCINCGARLHVDAVDQEAGEAAYPDHGETDDHRDDLEQESFDDDEPERVFGDEAVFYGDDDPSSGEQDDFEKPSLGEPFAATADSATTTFPNEEKLNKIKNAHYSGDKKIIVVIGTAGTGKTWFLRRLLKLCGEGKLAGWSARCDNDLYQDFENWKQQQQGSGFSDYDETLDRGPFTEGEFVDYTVSGNLYIHEFNRVRGASESVNDGYSDFLLVDIAGEDFKQTLEKAVISKDANEIHMLGLFAAADAFIFLVPSDAMAMDKTAGMVADPDKLIEDKVLDDLHDRIKIYAPRIAEFVELVKKCEEIGKEGFEELLNRGIKASDGALIDKHTRRRSTKPFLVLMSRADLLHQNLVKLDMPEAASQFDIDPVRFAKAAIPEVVYNVGQYFEYFRFDFVTAFDRTTGDAHTANPQRLFYQLPHYGVVSAFEWLEKMFRPRGWWGRKMLKLQHSTAEAHRSREKSDNEFRKASG